MDIMVKKAIPKPITEKIVKNTEQSGAKSPNAFILLVYGLDKKKKVAKISLSDQILLFIVQREAIVDITGTLKKPNPIA